MMEKAESSTAFFLTLLYLVFEYARPQDTFGFIGAFRPQLILSMLLLGSLVVNMRRLTLVASKQTTRLLLLLFLMAAYVPFSVNTGRAFAVTREYLQVVIVAVSIMQYVNTAERLRTLMNVWIWLMIYVAGSGILGAGNAGSSFLQDENDFAHLMVIMLPFGVFLFSYETRKISIFYLFASLVCAASVVASFSRGGFIGLLIVAFVLWIQSSRKIVMLVSATAFLVVVANLKISHSGTETAGSTYWQEMMTSFQTDDEDYNKESRKELWKAGWQMFKDHPLGVGPQNFPVHLPDYQSAYFGAKNMWGKQAHSIWFTLLPELGVPGLLLYFSLLFANIRDLRSLANLQTRDDDLQRFIHSLSLAFSTAIAGYLASGSFISVLYYPHYWYLTAMIVATRKIAFRAVEQEPGNAGRDVNNARTSRA